jgi:phage terminase large subunit-like protein
MPFKKKTATNAAPSPVELPPDLPPEVQAIANDPAALEAIVKQFAEWQRVNKAAEFKPYAAQRAFLDAGAKFRERCLFGANQVGKSLVAAFELAAHLTGDYPSWWAGRRFTAPIVAWACGVTAQAVRQSAQRLLLGREGDLGTGMIPADKLDKPTYNRAIPGAVDTVRVRHKSGGWSTLTFKSYEQGREKLQGETLHFAWCDEEPPVEHYMEIAARTTATDGSMVLTFTPLSGAGEVVRMFHPRPNTPDRWMVRLTAKDVVDSGHGHITEEMLARLTERYKDDPQREARLYGLPVLGEAAVYPTPRSELSIPAFNIPAHWRRIGGIDFGWQNAAAAAIAHDPDADVVYLYDCQLLGKGPPRQHAEMLRRMGEIPWAWPHDAHTLDRGSGMAISKLYKDAGLDMLGNHATHEDGGIGVEAGIAKINDRMATGRFKVFDHLEPFFAEHSNYYRKDGKIAKGDDHILDALRYCVVMLRSARPPRKVGFGQRTSIRRGVKSLA